MCPRGSVAPGLCDAPSGSLALCAVSPPHTSLYIHQLAGTVHVRTHSLVMCFVLVSSLDYTIFVVHFMQQIQLSYIYIFTWRDNRGLDVE